MASCPKCQSEVPAESVECPYCGVILAKYRRSTAPLPTIDAPAEAPAAAVPVNEYPEAPRISAATIESIQRMRPWLRFLAVYGFIMLGLMLVGGVVLLLSGLNNPRFLPLGLVYLAYGFIGFAIVLPIHRSAMAINELPRSGASLALETLAAHQLAFWRRSGILTVVGLVIAGMVLVLAIVFGALAALSR